MYLAHLRSFRIDIWQRGEFQKKIGLKYSRIIYNFKQKNVSYFAFSSLKIKSSPSPILFPFSSSNFFQPLCTLFISRYPLSNYPSAPLRSSSCRRSGFRIFNNDDDEMVTLLVALLSETHKFLWYLMVQVLRNGHPLKAGWQEYKRCFCTEHYSRVVKFSWCYCCCCCCCMLPLLLTVKTPLHACTRYRRLTRPYANTLYRFSCTRYHVVPYFCFERCRLYKLVDKVITYFQKMKNAFLTEIVKNILHKLIFFTNIFRILK